MTFPAGSVLDKPANLSIDVPDEGKEKAEWITKFALNKLMINEEIDVNG